jgi:NADH-quinone oxidoreductase subunit G
VRDLPDGEGWRRALGNADFIVSFSLLENETTARADVLFPLESHAEKEGTVTHPDGRLQRVRPSAERPGDIRPGWQVLAEIAAGLGHETGISSAPDALAAVADAVPFYAGITDDEIGGRGIRWQDREAAAALPEVGGPDGTPSRKAQSSLEGAPSALPSSNGDASADAKADGSLLLGTYRDIWAGPVTEHNPPLRFLEPKQRVEIAPEDAERLGVSDGDLVTVGRNGTSVEARVAVRERMREGAVFLIEGTSEGNANVLLDGQAVVVDVRKVEAAEVRR